MTALKGIFYAVAITLALVVAAQAIPITISFDDDFTQIFPVDEFGNPLGDIPEVHSTIPFHAEEGAEEGTLKGYYDASFVVNTGGDITQVTITHVNYPDGDPNPVVTDPEIFVKAGPGVFQYTGSEVWDGFCTLIIVTDNPRNAISHVDVTEGSTVPDGGTTVSLLGLSLLGVGALRRKLKA